MSIESLTEAKLDGNGVFDKLMRAAKVHLDAEYAKDRISGGTYAEAYVSITQAVLQQAIQYALTEPTNTAQVALLEAQTTKTDVERELVSVQRANSVIEGDNLTKQGLRLDKDVELAEIQKTKLNEDINLVQQQIGNLAAEGLLIPKKGVQLDAQTAEIEYQSLQTQQQTLLTTQQRTNLVTENANAVKQGTLLDTQNTKLEKDIAQVDKNILQTQEQTLFTEQQRINLTAENFNIPKQGILLDKQALKLDEEIAALDAGTLQAIEQTKLITEQVDKTIQDTALISSNVSKINKEIEVLEQRKKSEEAQIKDVVDGLPVTGVLGKQKSLYGAQTDGFVRDAEQKAAKMMIDVWSVQRTTDTGFESASAGLANTEIAKAVGKLLDGIDANV